MDAVLAVFSPDVIFPVLMAMTFGIFVGGLPGLTATMAVALIIPISYYMTPLAGLGMVLGVSFTSIFSGDIPATFLRIPGTPASGAAALDGFELAKKGKGSLALTLDLFCSAIGGLIGILLLILVAPPLANFALQFTNFEYFWLGLFGLSMSAVLSKGNMVKGLTSAVLGLAISTIGIDVTTGFPRYTFSNIELMDGLGFIPVMIGLFGISEVLKRVQQGASKLQLPPITEKVKISPLEALRIIWQNKWTLIKSAFVGTFVGALPGAGADIASWVAYGVEKKTSRNSEDFGKGNIKGVIAPTSANNAALGGTWIPALVFGVPGDTITAIVLGAMLMYGLKPGPLIFTESPDLVNGVFSIAILANILLIPIGYLGIKAFAFVLKMKTSVVLTAVVLFSMIGSFAIRNSYFDIYVMLIFGLIGFLFERLSVPLAPMILGLILGPMVEDNLRVGLIKTGGSMGQFFTRPISLVLFILIVLVFLGGPALNLLKKGFSKHKTEE